MGCGMIRFAGVVIVISSTLKLSSAVIDLERKKVQDGWATDCPLDADSDNPWLVKIWDVDYGQMMSHGSILAHQVVLSTCAAYIDADNRISRYIIVGQNVRSADGPHEKCTQSKKVVLLYRHPGCNRNEALKGEPRSTDFVNLAIWILKGHFETEKNFPTLKLHSFNPPSTFLDDLHKLEASPDNSGCSLPNFNSKDKMNSDSPKDTSVTLIPYSKSCVAMMCEGAEDEEACRSSNATKEGVRMCVIPKWTAKFSKPGKEEPSVDWYNGSPLVCNKLSYGISTSAIIRSNNTLDFFLITTFLDHFPWLKKTIQNFESSPSEKKYHTDGLDTTSRDPSKLAIDQNDYTEEKTQESQVNRKSRAAIVHHHLRPIFYISALTICFRLCLRV